MTQPDVPVVRPPGEFTAETGAAFEEACAPYLETHVVGVVIDLDAVEIITSSGFGRLVNFGQSLDANGASLALAGGRRKIVRLIYEVGLDAVMPHFSTVKEAQTFVLGQER